MKKIIQALIVCGLFVVMGGTAIGGSKENIKKLKETKACIKCDFTGARFMGGDFSGVNLTEANLSKARFVRANFKGANLTNANLSKARIGTSSFDGANLTNVNLTKARINESSFEKANLTKANLTKADLLRNTFKDANLSGAILIKASLKQSVDLTGINVAGVDITKCTCPENLPDLITKSNDPEYIKANQDRLNAENEKKIKVAKLAEKNVQKANNKKLRRANKKLKIEFKREIKKFLKAYKVLEESIQTIETCCDKADDKGDPNLKNYIAEQKRNFTGQAESLRKTYSKYITMGKDLSDPSKKDQKIQELIELNPKIKLQNPQCVNAELGSRVKKGKYAGHEVVTYEERQECVKEVEAELKELYGNSTQYFRSIGMAIIKECPIHNCLKGGIDEFKDMTLALERSRGVIENEVSKNSTERFNMAITKFIKNKEANDLKEKRIAQRKKKIALITNTLIYKEMIAAFEKGFMTNPQNVMLMMQLKIAGKSDSELAELWNWGTKSYNACMFREVEKRFSDDQLKQMATELGTNRLEIVSISVKCQTTAANTFLEILQEQQ
jgi:hypothetical protein